MPSGRRSRYQVLSNGFGVAHILNQAHIRRMPIRSSALMISKRDHDRARGARLGLQVGLGLIALRASFRFGP
jgi:hypothetical protein